MLARANMPAVIKNAVTQAYKGLFIGDAVSMPVHWYYDVPRIKQDFNGWIKQYERPKDNHPTSILRLSNTGGSGRRYGKEPPPVIGHVILHDKLSAWTEKATKTHYHQGLNPGDNTLNCHCTLLLMKTLHSCDASMSDEDVVKKMFYDYVKFMTTPGSHPDTYAESWHRSFFSDWVSAGKPTDIDKLYEFATKRSERMYAKPPDSQLSVIGAFVVPTTLILHNIHRPLDEVMAIAERFYSRTHPVDEIIDPLNSYIKILHAVVRGASLKEEAEKALVKHMGPPGQAMVKKFDSIVHNSSNKLEAFQRIGEQLGIACYIQGSFAIILFIAKHYFDDFEGGILTNVNVGGENCHRGSALGALLGASVGSLGKEIPSKWTKNLTLNSAIDEILV